MTILLHPDRFNYTDSVKKLGVVVHDSESGDGSSASLVSLLKAPGDRTGGYGAGYHAVTDGHGGYVEMADGTAGPFAAPPLNYSWWHVCMPGFANQTRAEWLDEVSRAHIRGVAKFIYDKWIADRKTWTPGFVFADQLVRSVGGYTSHYQVSLAWKKTNHYDPGPTFPWDVLESDLYQLIHPQEDDEEMSNIRFIRNKGYINVFLVGAGPALAVSGEIMNSYPADTPRVFQDHLPSLRAMCYQSGMVIGDLTTGGPEDKF